MHKMLSKAPPSILFALKHQLRIQTFRLFLSTQSALKLLVQNPFALHINRLLPNLLGVSPILLAVPLCYIQSLSAQTVYAS